MGRIEVERPGAEEAEQGKSLPDLDVTVIHRSDNSGTTYNLTEYLNAVSRQWKSSVGKGVVSTGRRVSVPRQLGCRRNAEPDERRITYVDIAYALKSHFKVAAAKNRAGVFSCRTSRDRGRGSDHPSRRAQQRRHLDRQSGEAAPLAYPICTFTYVIVPTNTPKARELKQFIRWAVTKEQASGPKLLFSPLPKVVLNASIKTLNSVHS